MDAFLVNCTVSMTFKMADQKGCLPALPKGPLMEMCTQQIVGRTPLPGSPQRWQTVHPASYSPENAMHQSANQVSHPRGCYTVEISDFHSLKKTEYKSSFNGNGYIKVGYSGYKEIYNTPACSLI